MKACTINHDQRGQGLYLNIGFFNAGPLEAYENRK